MKVALIDYNISQTFKDALKSDVVPIMIEQDDTFASLKEKILAVDNVTNIVIAQHLSFGKFRIGSEDVLFFDTTTWDSFKQFLIDMKATGVNTVDFLACLLYSQPDVPEMFAQLETETGIDLRASSDDTGNAEVGGNWVLESDMIDVESLYFTQAINTFRQLFFTYSVSSGKDNKATKDVCGNLIYFNRDINGYPTNLRYDQSGINVKIPSSSVVTWGDPAQGGNVGTSLSTVISVANTNNAFAALRSDGSVYAWGRADSGGSLTDGTYGIISGTGNVNSGVIAIYGNNSSFAALKSDGSVVTWGNRYNGGDSRTRYGGNLSSGVVEIFSTNVSFAALKSDGSVVTWGSENDGGNPAKWTNANVSSNVVTIVGSGAAFAALKTNGSVVAWGNDSWGGDPNPSTTYGIKSGGSISSGVRSIYSTGRGFAALKSDGSVVTWGYADEGGSHTNATYGAKGGNVSSGVQIVYSNIFSFAALKSDGSVVTWGYPNFGGDVTHPTYGVRGGNVSSGVVTICSGQRSFAALKSDGSVVTWGDPDYGANISTVYGGNITSGVVSIYSTLYAYAALKSDGSVVTWGSASNGGNRISGSYKEEGGDASSNVISIVGSWEAFAALKTDGSVVTWGNWEAGGRRNDSYWGTKYGNVDSGVAMIYPIQYGFAALKPDSAVTLSNYYYPTGATKLVQVDIAPSTSVAVDASNVNVTIYKHPYNTNATTPISVSASGGSETYTYSWSGATSTTNTANIPYKTSPTSEQISVTVSDRFTTATKIFNVTYAEPSTVSSFSTPIPTGEIKVTADNRVAASTTTGVGSFVGTNASVASYTAPTSGGITTLAAKFSDNVDAAGYITMSFDVDKYDASGTKVESTLGSTSTYGTMLFDISSGRPLVVKWTNTSGTIYTMATYNPSATPSIVTYNSATLTLTSTSGGRNYFTYVGPNSQTLIGVNPAGVSGIPCFVAGTRILTPTGEKLVENLRTGDLILTADGRKVPVTLYTTKIAKTTKDNAPYLIPANAFSAHFPPQDITLSPKHAIQSGKGIWEIPQFAEGRFPAVQKTRVGEAITYYHIELPNFFTDNIVANGSVCESLGTKAQKMLPKGQAMYSFSKKLNGFTRYNPEAKKASKKC